MKPLTALALAVPAVLAPSLAARVDALEARVAALEGRPQVASPATARGRYTAAQAALLDALIQVESAGDDLAVGDGGNAIGCLQIWKVYWIDATERSGIGGTYADCYDREYAKQIAAAYFTRYCREKWTEPAQFDAEFCARVHNGGPKGWRKSATDGYWSKVRGELR